MSGQQSGQQPEAPPPRPGINWLQVTGAALAAVSSAVLLSTLGVAGTMIGAALGSVVVSVGGALYTHGLDLSRQQVAAAQAAALRRVAQARSELERGRPDVADKSLDRAERDLEEAAGAGGPAGSASDAPAPAASAGGRSRWSGLPWRHIAAVTVAVFVIAMVTITGFELVTGRAVSTYTGGSGSGTGSTVPGLGRKADTHTHSPSPRVSPSDGGSTDGATDTATSPSASASEDGSDAATPTETPIETPGESDTALPSEVPSTSVPPAPASPTATGP